MIFGMAKQKPTNRLPATRRPAYARVVLSVALVLFLLGFFGLLLIQAGQLSKAMKEKVELIVEIQDSLDDTTRKKLSENLEKQVYVKAGTLAFTSKEEALKQMSEEFGEEVLRLELPNPLFDIYTFNVHAQYLLPDSLRNIQAKLRQLPGVADVYFQESLADQVAINLKSVMWALLAIGVVLLGFAGVLIHSVIRLALNADRFLIKTQELVGGTWEFITRPYLRQSIRHGIASATLAIGGLALVQWWLESQILELSQLQNMPLLAALAGALLLLGLSINWLSTYYTVRKYLRLRVDDLY